MSVLDKFFFDEDNKKNMKYRILSFVLALLLIFGQEFSAFVVVPACAAVNKYNASAVKYAETAHTAYQKKDFLKSAQYYEKAYALTKNKVFIDNAITSYTGYAYDLAGEKKYDEGIKYCLHVLLLRPEEPNTRELLSDIYYERGSENFYKGMHEKAGQDFENSLKYSTLQEQAQKAKDGLSLIAKGGGKSVSSVRFKSADSSLPSAIPEVVSLMEMKIYGNTKGNLPLISRIQKLEKDLFNNNYEQESINTRLNRLQHSILPELSQKLSVNSEQDYVQELIEQSGGTAKIFGKMPILIYIEESYSKNYKNYFVDAVKEAMKEWETASAGKLKFEITYDRKKSNMKIVWTDTFEDFAWQPELKKEDISAAKQKIKYGKASTLVQIGSIAAMVLGGVTGVPLIGMAGSLGGSVASPFLQYKSLDLDDSALSIKINTNTTVGMTKEQSMEKIKQIAMHQLGHSVGIYGHSANHGDLMYSNFSVNKLSDRDKNTIKEIYKNVNIN